ncbi:unnamed protein product [Echinostoma caproni]|uniref:DNA replication complex GINS protein SLD5 n=1 Tax=Echinostoma caproni TaxID=27848 RepID=A0A183AHG2_9TREM|nr:unnamed protein product [Echinostoma caproni]
MASVRVLDRIELDRYVIPLRTIAENPEFRTTQKSLEFELNEQRSAREEAAWISESILPQHQHILDDLQDIQDQIADNEAGVEYLMGITEMEHLYSDMRLEVDLCWDNVQRYAELSNIHLKNAAEYHRSTLIQFEQFARESENLSTKSHMIVPIYMRTQPLIDEVDGIMLCDYDMGDFKFRAGDRIVIVSNRVPVTTQQPTRPCITVMHFPAEQKFT